MNVNLNVSITSRKYGDASFCQVFKNEITFNVLVINKISGFE